MNRREFLCALLASGAAGGIAVPALADSVTRAGARPAPASRAVLVTGGSAVDFAFACGAVTAANACGMQLAGDRLNPDELTRPGKLMERFTGWDGQVLVGVMEDSLYSVFHEMARTSGVRELFSAQHTWGRRYSRHRLVTTAASRGVGAALAGAAHSEGETCDVKEHLLGSASNAQVCAPVAASGHWVECLGESLVEVASGNWPRDRYRPGQRGASATAPSGTGSVVSFVMAV